VSFDATTDSYHANDGALDQVDDTLQVTATTRKLLSLTGLFGSHSLFIPHQGLLPFNQSGFALGYLDGTSTPTDVSWQAGSYGHGYLNTLLSSTNIPIFTRKATVGFVLQGTDYRPNVGPQRVQWLEDAFVNWEINSRSSFSIGVRKIIGTAPPYPSATSAVNVTNLAASYHYLQPDGELYVAYGNPNNISTYPAAILKYIFYIGAPKGT
jgi:hypothetical protein